jgi:acyl-CoA synthetase (NDP forming)
MSGVLDCFRPLFHPESIAVIGASNTYGKWGYTYLRNLRDGGFAGRVFPVNPKEKEILGYPVYPRLEDVPGSVDLALILLRPELVLDAVRECLARGVRAMVVITAGFGEMGGQGKKMQDEFAALARKARVPLIGPNCMGLISVPAKLNAQLFYSRPLPGGISILSQSGNLGGDLIRRGMVDRIGFSKFVSSGNEAVTTCEDLLEYFGEDPDTTVILSYLEGVKHGNRFLEIARRVTAKKPVVLLKAGYTSAGSRACVSHTGALAGSQEVFEAVARQAGVIMVDNMDDLYYAGVTLAGQPLPSGKRIGIVTEGGGMGVIAADATVRFGMEVPLLTERLQERFHDILPERWSRANPVDTAAGEGKFECIEEMVRSSYFDGIIQIGIAGAGRVYQALSHIPESERTDQEKQRLERLKPRVDREIEEARFITGLIRETGKPILSADQVSVLGQVEGNPVLEYLSSQGIIVYRDSYHAARMMGILLDYASRHIKGSWFKHKSYLKGS